MGEPISNGEQLIEIPHGYEPAIRPDSMRHMPVVGDYPDAEINLAVAQFIDVIPYKPAEYETISQTDVQHAWQALLQRRAEAAGQDISQALPQIAMAVKSEVFYRHVFPSVVNHHVASSGKKLQLVPGTGYPIPFWTESDAILVEAIIEDPQNPPPHDAQLERVIQNAKKLPADIGTMYLDYPSTFLSKYSPEELAAFIKANKDVLFLLDQANVHVRDTNDNAGLDFILNDQLGNNDLVLVTATSTKSHAAIGYGTLHGTKAAQDMLASMEDGLFTPGEVRAVDMDKPEYYRALSILMRHDDDLEDYRASIDANCEFLIRGLQTELGEGAVFHGDIGTGHIFLDVTRLGYNNPRDFCKELYQRHGIATKPAHYYGNKNKYPALQTLVYVGIPIDNLDSIIEAIQATSRK